MGVSLRDHAARSAVRSALDLAALALAVVLATGGARAAPGFGPPLDATTGTVYAVGTVAQLKAAVNAANAAGQPATILLANGTYVLDVAALQLACPGLIVRGASGDRDAVVVRGPDTGSGASVNHIFLISAHRVTIADLSLGACRNHGVQIRDRKSVV